MDNNYSYLSFLSDKELYILILGTVFGAFASIISSILVALYFSDHAYLPFMHRRTKFFRTGKYILYAPSREDKSSLIKWDVEISKKNTLRCSEINMSCFFKRYSDTFAWKYNGPFIKIGSYVYGRMDIKKSKMLSEHSNGITYTNPTIDHDPCFIILKGNTENWPVRPCSILGFDIDANCYGALGLLINAESPIDPEKAKILLSNGSFLEFTDLMKRIDRSHNQ